MEAMKIAMIGAGYVGLTAAAVYAKLGHTVFLFDTNVKKMADIRRGHAPFFEPGLPELIKKFVREKGIIPTERVADAVSEAEIIFICVGTPPKQNGQANLTGVFAAVRSAAKYFHTESVLVIKSTVPVGTSKQIRTLIEKSTRKRYALASCPEFLREGSAIFDSLHPDRIVIGSDQKQAIQKLLELHKKLPGERVITNNETAEIIKYASNAFLATKISFINEIANLCEQVGANVDDVSLGMGLDPRIGKAFLKAGIGYGGSCFPKDTRALRAVALSHHYDFKLLKAVIEVNQKQRELFKKKILRLLGTVRGKRIGVLGLAFKNNTDDVRESAAMDIAGWLLKQGAKVNAYDPKASANAKKILPKLSIAKNAEKVFENADAVLILTEWPEFKRLDWKKLRTRMRNSPRLPAEGKANCVVLDGRNILKQKTMHELGYQYFSMGR